MQIDFLIIGQGLAGSLLAWELMQRGQSVLIVDDGAENASQVAAGLINPVTGKRLVKTQQIERLLPVASQYYRTLEGFFDRTFFVEKQMFRLLRNAQERRLAEQRLNEPGYRDYLTRIADTNPLLNSPFGLLQQQQTSYLLTQPLLKALRNFFIERHCFQQCKIDYHDIRLLPTPRWKNHPFRQVIFCEGYQAITNPWFNWLPFQPVKGEIVTGNSQLGMIEHILNYGHWFIPLDEQHFKTGATFDREHLDCQQSEQGKSVLLSELRQVYPSLQIRRIIRQQAGVRPATQDRQPFIGCHPRWPELAIFNGFGAKGSLMIPAYCQTFADFLLRRTPLPKVIDIQRHVSESTLA